MHNRGKQCNTQGAAEACKTKKRTVLTFRGRICSSHSDSLQELCKHCTFLITRGYPVSNTAAGGIDLTASVSTVKVLLHEGGVVLFSQWIQLLP